MYHCDPNIMLQGYGGGDMEHMDAHMNQIDDYGQEMADHIAEME